MSSITTTVQTRIPAFLWESLQDVMYQHDYEFLKIVSMAIRVPVAELKHKLLGSRGQMTAVTVSDTLAWWEKELCPVYLRSDKGVWKPCGNYRQAHGYCCDHLKFQPTFTRRRYDDPYFNSIVQRKPVRFDDEIIWVSEAGDAIRESGVPIRGLHVDLQRKIMKLTE